jgi:hypothetical protein
MRRQAYIRPSRASSFIGTIGGSIMLMVGIGFMIFMGSTNPPAPIGAYIFTLVWICVAAGGVIYNIYNLNTGNAFPMEVADYDDGELPRDSSSFANYSVVDRLPDADAPKQNSDTASRLKDLQSLLDQNLITADEFNQKRSEILNQL